MNTALTAIAIVATSSLILLLQVSAFTTIYPPRPTFTSTSPLLTSTSPLTMPITSDVSSTSTALNYENEMQQLLSTLDKRVTQGPGSLSLVEVEEFQLSSERILNELKKLSNGAVEAVEEVAIWEAGAVGVVKAVEKLEPDEPVAAVDEAHPPPPPVTPTTPIIPTSPIDVSIYDTLETALTTHDIPTITSLLATQPHLLTPELTNLAFWSVVQAVDDAEARDKPLPASVPILLHHIFDADLRHLLENRPQERYNVTCMQPRKDNIEDRAKSMGYVFDDMAHRDLPLSPGRVCEGGNCCEECSRNIFREFATLEETDFSTYPQIESFTFNDLTSTPSATILQFTRLIERVRRTMAHEYGLDLKTLLPLQAYSRKYVAGTTQKGGGGGEGDFVILHTDESTHAGYHYSCVIYLSTQGEDFIGGDFVFNDPEDEVDEALLSEEQKEEREKERKRIKAMPFQEQVRRAGRKLTPYHPTKGSAVIFSSGWENMHEVEKITSGTRYAVPCFFTTCPVPEAAYDQMVVGKPGSEEDQADDWLHLLLAHREENPMESVGRVKELLMKWHYMCTPLSMH